MEVSETQTIVWEIEGFPKFHCRKVYSDTFSAGGFQWCLVIFPRGNETNSLSLYLEAAESLPDQYSIRAKVSFCVIDQHDECESISGEAYVRFNSKRTHWGTSCLMPLHKVYDPMQGYLVKDTLVIKAKVTVLEFHTQSDYCPDKTIDLKAYFEEYFSGWTTTRFCKGYEEADHMSTEGSEDDETIEGMTVASDEEGQEVVQIEEVAKTAQFEVLNQVVSDDKKSHFTKLTDGSNKAKEDQEEPEENSSAVLVSDTEPKEKGELVNGFFVPISQLKEVKDAFKKHPDLASNFHPKNGLIRKVYMKIFIGIIKILCRSPKDITEDEIGEVVSDLNDLEASGFKLDWLKPKVEETVRRRERVVKSDVDGISRQLSLMKKLATLLEAKLEEEKADVAAAAIPLSLEDILD